MKSETGAGCADFGAGGCESRKCRDVGLSRAGPGAGTRGDYLNADAAPGGLLERVQRARQDQRGALPGGRDFVRREQDLTARGGDVRERSGEKCAASQYGGHVLSLTQAIIPVKPRSSLSGQI